MPDDDVRPFDATDWEKESAADQAEEFHTLEETSKVVAAAALAHQQIVADALLSENRIQRRRNTLLTVMVALLMAGIGALLWREYTVVGPQRNNIEQTVEDVATANRSLDKINAFIAQVEAEREQGSSNPEVARVFEAVFDIRRIICEIDDPPLAVEACAGLA